MLNNSEKDLVMRVQTLNKLALYKYVKEAVDIVVTSKNPEWCLALISVLKKNNDNSLLKDLIAIVKKSKKPYYSFLLYKMLNNKRISFEEFLLHSRNFEWCTK